MYGVVLMMAMTTGTETPDCGGRWGGGYCGCYGGCYGWSSYCGCYGGYYGGYGYGNYYGSNGYYGATVVSRATVQPSATVSAAPARIIVSLPADAKLTFDGVPTTSKSKERVFLSPKLQPNRDFHYTLKAEVIRDGKPVRIEQTITVQAGKESRVTLDLPQSVASK